MKKTIHHVWKKTILTDKKDHKKCERCNCEKWFDYSWHKIIFYKQNNGTFEYHKTPECVLPNTKL